MSGFRALIEGKKNRCIFHILVVAFNAEDSFILAVVLW